MGTFVPILVQYRYLTSNTKSTRIKRNVSVLHQYRKYRNVYINHNCVNICVESSVYFKIDFRTRTMHRISNYRTFLSNGHVEMKISTCRCLYNIDVDGKTETISIASLPAGLCIINYYVMSVILFQCERTVTNFENVSMKIYE